jgi:uncharacterized protein YegJ (DUF2314 family)
MHCFAMIQWRELLVSTVFLLGVQCAALAQDRSPEIQKYPQQLQSQSTQIFKLPLIWHFTVLYSPQGSDRSDLALKELLRKQFSQFLFNSKQDSRNGPELTTEQVSLGASDLSEALLLKSKKEFHLYFTDFQPNQFKNLKASNELVAQLAVQLKGFIYDGETREYFSPQSWQQKRVATWTGQLPDVGSQISAHFLTSKAQLGSHRLVSLGMAKFGIPDLCVENLSANTPSSFMTLISDVAQTLVESKKLDPPGKLTLSSQGRKVSLDLNLSLSRQNGDPERILEIQFPGTEQEPAQVKRSRALKTLYGTADQSMHWVRHDRKVEELSRQAKKELSLLAPRFQERIPENESLRVEASFHCGKSAEYLWVQVTRWRGNKIVGTLTHNPACVSELKQGDVVTLDQDSVFDYLYRRSDQTTVGNETGKYLSEVQKY